MLKQQCPAFEEGDMVRILGGPFAGLRATIAAISEDQRILKVILRFFGRKHAVEVFLMDVEKIS